MSCRFLSSIFLCLRRWLRVGDVHPVEPNLPAGGLVQVHHAPRLTVDFPEPDTP